MSRKLLKFITMMATTFFTASIIFAGAPKRGGTLVWSIGTTPRHLNPAVQSGIATGGHGGTVICDAATF